jgi:hypothetical protein
MTENYVTLFDSFFIPQGLALYKSLEDKTLDYTFWVLCVDDNCLSLLRRLDLPNMRLLDLNALENEELLKVKSIRSSKEYCWTLTPWAIQWVFESDDSVGRVTYLDADTYFLNDPIPVLEEFEASGKGFMITDHAYSPDYDQTPTSGRYCVQFVPVARGLGEIVLHWWRDRCLEWCYERYERGMFGDQMYFEQMPSLFPELVYIASTDSRFLAPWNARYYRYTDAVLYHFQGLRILSPTNVIIQRHGYRIPDPVIQYVYKPYIQTISALLVQYPFISLKPQVSFSAKLFIRIVLACLFAAIYRLERYSQRLMRA